MATLQPAFKKSTNRDPVFLQRQLDVNTFFAHHRAGTLVSSAHIPQGRFDFVPRGVRQGAWAHPNAWAREQLRHRQTLNQTPWLKFANGQRQTPPGRFDTVRNRVWERVAGKRMPVRPGGRVRNTQTLGYGGNGIVYLFETYDGTTSVRKNAVVKATLRPGSNMKQEKEFTLAMKRARHIVQLRRWQGEVMYDENAVRGRRLPLWPLNRMAHAWRRFDKDDKYMVLEYMKHGDVMHLIVRTARAKQRVPNGVLWRVFICLIRACIAMQFPPRAPPDLKARGARWTREIGPDMEERITPLALNAPYDLVHFDLDVQNILVGDFDDRDHQILPVFKVSDFGLSERTNRPEFSKNPNWAYIARRLGKYRLFLPEQFHQEWEYLDTIPSAEPQPPQVAGQYGPRSNIWAMATCIQFPFPPVAFPMNNRRDTSHFRPNDIPQCVDFQGRLVEPFHSYGFNLYNEPGLDRELMCLLIRCLADRPADRPGLEELQQWADRKEAQPGWNNPDDGTREWGEPFFGTPPPVSAFSNEMGRMSFLY